MHRNVVACLSAFIVLLSLATPSRATLNKCAAAKRVCVAKEVAALLGCHSKSAKSPGLTPDKLTACIQKAKDKFDGGNDPAKGCFAKLEAKFAGSCLTTGDTAAFEAKVDAFVAEANCDLDAGTCFPQTCLDIRNDLAESGQSPANGSYTLYIDRNPNLAWTVYCDNMNTEDPSEYLSVDESDNYSQISNGTVVTQTSYRRLRIDPVTFVVDLLDSTFATTEEGVVPPPGGRSHVPAGWAQFVSPQDNDGPPASAQIDLTGTGFALAESILADDLSFFCSVTGEGSPTSPSDGSEVVVMNDLSSFTLSAIDSTANSVTRVVADCTHLSASDENFTTAQLPLQYVDP